MLIVEIAARIDEWFLMVGLFHQVEEIEQRVAEHVGRQASRRLNVNHRDEVLLTRQTLRHEIIELALLVGQRTIEMIAAHLQSIAVSQFYVALEGGIDTITTLGSLQIDIRHIGHLADSLPKHVTLIVAQVNAMNVGTRVFALHKIVALSFGRRQDAGKYSNQNNQSFHLILKI